MKDRIRNCLAALEPRLFTNGFTREALCAHAGIQIRRRFLLSAHASHRRGPDSWARYHFRANARRKRGTRQTALRETFEEVGIEEERIEILCCFHDYISINGYRVAPFAGFIDGPFTTTPQIHEVAEVLKVPFGLFLDPEKLRKEKSVFRDKEVNVYFFSYGNHQIWGLTARIIKEFMETLNLNC